MKKNILITHAFGPDNRGDHELLLKLIEIIKHKYGENISITVFTSFPEKSANVFNDENITFIKSPISMSGLSKSLINFLKLFVSLFNYLLYYLLNIEFLLNKNQKEKIKCIKNAEIIFYTPGGYLYSNGRSFYANIANGLLLKKSKALIYFSPMSIGPFYNKMDVYLCKLLLKSATGIFLRESYSYNLVSGMGLKSVYLTTDLAWYQSTGNVICPNNKWKGRYVITIIDWDYNDVGNQEYYKKRYFKEIVECCKYLAIDSNKKVVLYNQVGTGKGNTKDELLIKRLIDVIPDFVEFEGEELTPKELKSRLKNSLGLVASRFHSALFAIQVEIPFIALSYQPKTEFILRDLSLSECFKQIYEFKGKDIAQFLIALSQDKDKYIKNVVKAKNQALRLINDQFYNILN